MTLSRIKSMNRDQRGMTLIELILVVSLVGIIGAAGTTTYFQVLKGSGISNNRAEAISNIERAADWFTVDALQAKDKPNPDQEIPDQENPVNPVTLEWPITLKWIDDTEKDEEENPIIKYITVIYDKEDDKLTREITVTDNSTGEYTTTIGQVARYISYINCDYYWDTDIYYLIIRATVGDKPFDVVIEERSYEIISRLNLK